MKIFLYIYSRKPEHTHTHTHTHIHIFYPYRFFFVYIQGSQNTHTHTHIYTCPHLFIYYLFTHLYSLYIFQGAPKWVKGGGWVFNVSRKNISCLVNKLVITKFIGVYHVFFHYVEQFFVNSKPLVLIVIVDLIPWIILFTLFYHYALLPFCSSWSIWNSLVYFLRYGSKIFPHEYLIAFICFYNLCIFP